MKPKSKPSEGPKRVATYCRVSRVMQNAENQTPEVESLADRKGVIVKRYVETGSATKYRPVFDEMREAAKRGEFDVLVIWAIDRFGRKMVDTIKDVTDLDKCGIALVSVREPWLDTTAPTRGLLLAIFSWMAEQERTRLIERIQAGIAEKVRNSEKLGGKEHTYGFAVVDGPPRLKRDGRMVPVKMLVDSPEEQGVIARIRSLNDSGIGYGRIPSVLAESGIFARSGKPFSKMQIRRILSQNPAGVSDGRQEVGDLPQAAARGGQLQRAGLAQGRDRSGRLPASEDRQQ